MPRFSRPALTGAALLSVLALGAVACDSGSGKGGADAAGAATPASSAPASPSEAASPSAPPVPALTAAQLKRAALTAADLPSGYRVARPAKGEDLLGSRATATPAACQPIQDMGAGKRAVKPTAAVDQNYPRTDKPTVMTFSRIAAYAPGGAERAMADLRAAVKACPSYTSKDDSDGTVTKIKVKVVQAPSQGDDAIALDLAGSSDGAPLVIRMVQVRSGSSLALFAALDFMEGGRAVEVAPELLEKQVGKLKAAAAG
ncbi:hypothetical protein [Streptomyces sp. NPDC001380]|uniref:hypothetical protein n=1 Tax=Streptomyces sp. NPDC001380 TaxID=3364566 RepID=UPI0036ABA941